MGMGLVCAGTTVLPAPWPGTLPSTSPHTPPGPGTGVFPEPVLSTRTDKPPLSFPSQSPFPPACLNLRPRPPPAPKVHPLLAGLPKPCRSCHCEQEPPSPGHPDSCRQTLRDIAELRPQVCASCSCPAHRPQASIATSPPVSPLRGEK